MSGSILPTTKTKTSRFLIQGQKQCGKRLKGKFATNLKKHFHRNITKTLCPSDECDKFKLSVCVVPVLVLVPSCKFV